MEHFFIISGRQRKPVQSAPVERREGGLAFSVLCLIILSETVAVTLPANMRKDDVMVPLTFLCCCSPPRRVSEKSLEIYGLPSGRNRGTYLGVVSSRVETLKRIALGALGFLETPRI